LRVVHRGGVEPGILGSDEPLHGGQRSGHNGKLIHGAKSQIRICVLAYSIRHAARGRADRPIGTASRRGRGEGTRCDEAHPGGDRHANQPKPHCSPRVCRREAMSRRAKCAACFYSCQLLWA
jgi:hypothetical protein